MHANHNDNVAAIDPGGYLRSIRKPPMAMAQLPKEISSCQGTLVMHEQPPITGRLVHWG